MKLFPFVGALILSATPVHASKTPEELTKPCVASEETQIACESIGTMYAAIMTLTVLCGLREEGVLPPNSWPGILAAPTSIDKDYEKVMWNYGVKSVLEDFPNCPIKPVR